MRRSGARVVLDKSQPRYASGAQITVRRPDLRTRARATLFLRNPGFEDAFKKWSSHRSRLVALDWEQIERDFGVSPHYFADVERYALRYHLEVDRKRKRPAECTVSLTGKLEDFGRAFGIEFVEVEGYVDLRVRRYRSHLGPILLPPRLSRVIEAVLGLDRSDPFRSHTLKPLVRKARVDPAKVAQQYRFPRDVDGTGETIAVILLGGDVPLDDIRAYFRHRGQRVPSIEIVRVEGHHDQMGQAEEIRAMVRQLVTKDDPWRELNDSQMRALRTLEAAVDLELLGTFAPGAKLVVYIARPTFHGKFEAFSRAIHDRRRDVSVICCCWGAQEDLVPPAVCCAFDRLFRIAALRGITICCSSGDDGGMGGVQFPASSPHVLACGGTYWEPGRRQRREEAWAWSGGGFSKVFEPGKWQARDVKAYRPHTKWRGVPDVAARANLQNEGYELVAGGCLVPMGGTSVAAPLWAGLVALLNQKLGARLGFLAPQLYRTQRELAFRKPLYDVSRGYSYGYEARSGWDACTGLGSPNGEGLLAALR